MPQPETLKGQLRLMVRPWIRENTPLFHFFQSCGPGSARPEPPSGRRLSASHTSWPLQVSLPRHTWAPATVPTLTCPAPSHNVSSQQHLVCLFSLPGSKSLAPQRAPGVPTGVGAPPLHSLHHPDLQGVLTRCPWASSSSSHVTLPFRSDNVRNRLINGIEIAHYRVGKYSIPAFAEKISNE